MNFKTKSFSEKTCILSAALNVITLIAFCIYGMMYDYLDTVVLLTLLLGIVASAAYAFINSKAVELLNLVAIMCVSFGMGLFFLNSYPVWADRLNHISMYSSRGTLLPVITLLIMMVAVIMMDIVSCFTAKGRSVRLDTTSNRMEVGK